MNYIKNISKDLSQSFVKNLSGRFSRRHKFILFVSLSSLLIICAMCISIFNSINYRRSIQSLESELAALSADQTALELSLESKAAKLAQAEDDLAKIAAYSKQMSLLSVSSYRMHSYDALGSVNRSDSSGASSEIQAAASSTDSEISELEALLSALSDITGNLTSLNTSVDLSAVDTLKSEIIENVAFTPSVRPCDSTYLTSYFGYRTDPFTGATKYHSGIDFAANYGASVYASASGIVSSAGYSSGYGYYIIISHGNGLQTLYGHASSLCVQSGDTVIAGDVIAYVGSTGRSTGPHLHFEVLKNSVRCNPLNYISLN